MLSITGGGGVVCLAKAQSYATCRFFEVKDVILGNCPALKRASIAIKRPENNPSSPSNAPNTVVEKDDEEKEEEVEVEHGNGNLLALILINHLSLPNHLTFLCG